MKSIKPSLYGTFVLLLLLAVHFPVKAQDVEHEVHTSINIKEAFELNEQYGIKLKDGVNLIGKSMTVHMYSEKRYHGDPDDAVIYAMSLDEHTPIPENPEDDVFLSEALIDNAGHYPLFYPLENLHTHYTNNTEYSLEAPNQPRDLTDYKNYLIKEMAYNGLFYNEGHLGLNNKVLKVVVVITLNGGLSLDDIDKINLPGLLIDEEAAITITVTKLGGGPQSIYYFDTPEDIREVRCVMGDRVEFKITQPNANPPDITGLPATWLAAMGREYYYHCDPSIVPGDIKPKVPFDVQSHYVSSNGATVERYPDWVQDTDNPNVFTLTWIAQRRTSTEEGTNSRYQARYKFKKADVLGTKMQRKSKSEGQIMDFLEIYNQNTIQSGDGHAYDPTDRKYYWNVDSDELLYFNTKDYDTHTPGWSGKVKRVPVYDVETPNDPYSVPSLAQPSQVESNIAVLYEPWQLVREGDYEWDDEDGFPKRGFAINDLVSAYRWHNDAGSSEYRGYEIEDECLYKNAQGECITPDETTGQPGLVSSGAVYNRQGEGPNDNNKHPGMITISKGLHNSELFDIPIEVRAPLSVDWGFYGNIITPEYSNAGGDVPLQVIGLYPEMTAGEQARYSLGLRSYSLQDFSEDTYVLGTDGDYNSSTGAWTLTKEEIGYQQAWSATLYYTADPNDPNTKVIVGGAEWKNTNIAYVFTTKDPYGGEACNDCLDLKSGYEEFADNYVQSDRYAYDFSTGYTQSFDGETFWQRTLRNYVLHLNNKNTRFVSMDALDNIWDMHGNAYYWGYRALAKQYTDAQLAQQLKYTVTNVTTGETSEHVGRTFDFLPSDYGVGEYELQVTSSDPDIGGVGSPIVGIKVVDYDETTEQKGRIYTRDLFEKERTILGLDQDANLANYRVAYVDDVLATYKYVDGYRADHHDGSKNRFAPYNDYREDYNWKTLINSGAQTEQIDVNNITPVQDKINAFDPTTYWKPEWINWLRHFSYGKFPVSKVSAAADQVIDSDYRSEISQLYDGGDFQLNEYLRALIWLAPTDYNGYRINGLMKTIVNLDQFFNNYAFSGNLTPPKGDKLPVFVTQEQDLTDDVKYELHLLRKLQNGEMIIYDASTVDNLQVYQSDAASNSTFVASNNNSDGIPLTIGQDLQTIQDYGSTVEANGNRSFPIPAAVTSYINLYAIRTNNDDAAPDGNGCATALVDLYGGLGEDLAGNLVTTYYNKGGGPLNTRQLADTYPNSDLNIGLLFSTIQSQCTDGSIHTITDMTDIPNGTYDAEIDRLITFCKSRTNQTIFLRPGYEFDLVWNIGYEDTEAYKAAYRHIVDRFNNQNVTNVKFVWQAAVSPFNYVDYLAYEDDLLGARDLFGTRVPHDPWELDDWYPGDDYVDIVGISYFENPDTKGPVAISTFTEARVKSQRDLTDKMLDLARAWNKPVMVAESTPRGYDIANLTKSNTHQYWDGPIYTHWDPDPGQRIKAGTVSVTASNIWDNFYQPLFDYVDLHSDVIKYFHYIDANWSNETLQWQWTNEYQYWGNARVEVNDEIKRKWQIEINKPKWIHGNGFHAPADLTIYDITATSAKFTWPVNDQPPVATFILSVTCPDASCSPYARVFSAPGWHENSYHPNNQLTASTTYKAKLSNIDYFGNEVGSIEKMFTTLPSTSTRALLNVNDLEQSVEWNVSIYPNPSKQNIVNVDLDVPHGGQFSMEMHDLNGRTVLKSELMLRKGANNTHLTVGSLPSGVYVINIQGNGFQFAEKLIIQH